MELGFVVTVTLVVVVMVIGYGVGARITDGRARRWRHALRQAFPRAGRTNVHSPTPNAFRLRMDNPVAGVSSLDLGAFPVPREMLPVWGFRAMTQSGNMVSLRCDLDALPRAVGRISDLDNDAGREAGQDGREERHLAFARRARSLRKAVADRADGATLELLAAIAREAGHVMLLETRMVQPRLSLVIAARGTPEVIAAQLPSLLERLALGLSS